MLDSAVRSGVLRVIIATTTLAVGVDFPVEVVILNGLKSGMTDLSPSEYKQMAGRAGRRSAGEVFVIESQDRFQFAISLMNATIPPVKSALTGDQRGIDRVLLEAVTLGIVSTLDDMMRYLHVSMLSLNVSESELRRIVIFSSIATFSSTKPTSCSTPISFSCISSHPPSSFPILAGASSRKYLLPLSLISRSALSIALLHRQRSRSAAPHRGKLHFLLRSVSSGSVLPSSSFTPLFRTIPIHYALQVLRRSASSRYRNGWRR